MNGFGKMRKAAKMTQQAKPEPPQRNLFKREKPLPARRRRGVVSTYTYSCGMMACPPSSSRYGTTATPPLLDSTSTYARFERSTTMVCV